MSQKSTCWVPFCKHTEIADKCSFFKFPDSISCCKEWLRVIGRTDFLTLPLAMLWNDIFVCSCHFTSKDYKSSLRKELKPNAVPSIFDGRMQPLPDFTINKFPPSSTKFVFTTHSLDDGDNSGEKGTEWLYSNASTSHIIENNDKSSIQLFIESQNLEDDASQEMRNSSVPKIKTYRSAVQEHVFQEDISNDFEKQICALIPKTEPMSPLLEDIHSHDEKSDENLDFNEVEPEYVKIEDISTLFSEYGSSEYDETKVFRNSPEPNGMQYHPSAVKEPLKDKDDCTNEYAPIITKEENDLEISSTHLSETHITQNEHNAMLLKRLFSESGISDNDDSGAINESSTPKLKRCRPSDLEGSATGGTKKERFSEFQLHGNKLGSKRIPQVPNTKRQNRSAASRYDSSKGILEEAGIPGANMTQELAAVLILVDKLKRDKRYLEEVLKKRTELCDKMSSKIQNYMKNPKIEKSIGLQLLNNMNDRNINRESQGQRYTERELSFAFEIYKVSSACYNFLRKHMNLPGKSCLQRSKKIKFSEFDESSR